MNANEPLITDADLAELRRTWQERRERMREILRRFVPAGMTRPPRDPAERRWIEERGEAWFAEDERAAEAARVYYARKYSRET